MCSMRNGKKTGLVLVSIAILYFLWILAVAFHEAGYILEDTDFIFSLVEWAAIGIVLYFCIIIIFCFFYLFPFHRSSKKKEDFKIVEGKTNQVVCSNCKTIFSFQDTGERPLEISCSHCKRKGILKGTTVSAKKHIISCSHCGNIFEVLDWDIRPLDYQCPECHQQDSIS